MTFPGINEVKRIPERSLRDWDRPEKTVSDEALICLDSHVQTMGYGVKLNLASNLQLGAH